VTEIDGIANYGGHHQHATTLRLSHHQDQDPDPSIEIIPAAGPLTGPIPHPAAASGATVASTSPIPAAPGTTPQAATAAAASSPQPGTQPQAGQAPRPDTTDGEVPEPGGVPMRFMNAMDIEQAVSRWQDHPVLGPAARTLASLAAWADRNGDGWAAWPAPARAAARLMTLIERDGTARYMRDTERPDATLAELLKAYTPVKTFRTRHNADFAIEDPREVTAPADGAADPLTAAPGPGTDPARPDEPDTSQPDPTPPGSPPGGRDAPASTPGTPPRPGPAEDAALPVATSTPAAAAHQGRTATAEPADPGEPLTPAEIRTGIRMWIAPSRLPGYVQAMAGNQPMRDWIEQQVASVGIYGRWYETRDPRLEGRRRENRADPSPDGLVVLRGHPGRRLETIAWEEIPAWLEGGLTSARRTSLTETAAALTALSAQQSPGTAAGQPGDQDRVEELRTRLNEAIDEAWTAIDAAPPPTVGQLEQSRHTYRDTSPVQDTLFPGQEAGSPAAPPVPATVPVRQPAGPAPQPGQVGAATGRGTPVQASPGRGGGDTLPASGGPDAPQMCLRAAAPEMPGLAPAGAAGRPVREHVQGPAGQEWVRDDEGTIWAWPASGGALIIVPDPQPATAAASSRDRSLPAAASPVPGHVRALAGRLIGLGGVTVRLDPPASPAAPDWQVSFVRGHGEEVTLTVPGSPPAAVTRAILFRFEISRGSRISTGRTELPVTAGQPATDGQLADWLRATTGPPAAPAPVPPPGQPDRPEGTRPLAQDGPWHGPIHPDLHVYQDGTLLAVRFQGAAADQTWNGTAAGIIPGTGPYEPGVLQVIAWQPADDGGAPRYSIVHPALTSRLTADPYQGLDPRQQERWHIFDQAAAAGSATAVLPARLLEPGDAVETDQPDGYRAEVVTVQSVTSLPGGNTKVEGPGTRGTVTLHQPPGEPFVTRIPASRPSAVRPDATASGHAEEPDSQAPAGADAAAAAPALDAARASPGPAGAQPPAGSPPTGTAAPAPSRHQAGHHGKPADIHRYNQLIRSQRARLDAAIASGDRDQVIAACREAVPTWNLPGNIWPPDADRWQKALDRFLPDGTPDDERLLLEDLAAEPVPDNPDDTDSSDEPLTLFDDVSDLGDPAATSRPGHGTHSPGPAPGTPSTTAPDPAGKPGPAPNAAADPAPAGASPAPPRHSQPATGITPGSPAPDTAPEPAETAPINNSDVAAAWQNMTASSSGRAWAAAEFITHGTVPEPGLVTGPGDPQDTTAWDGDGLRRTVASEQPGRDGTLTWEQARRWIDAGMTPGDLRILLEAGRVVKFCDGWLEQVRDTADQQDAFYDAGHGATVIVQDCIGRVTAAAAHAHGPDAPVPAAPAGTDSYRQEQVTTTAEQDRDLAAIRELSKSAHQAARRVTRSGKPARQDTRADVPDTASPGGPAAPAPAGPGTPGTAAGVKDARPAGGPVPGPAGRRDDDGPRHSGDTAPAPHHVGDDQVRDALGAYRRAAASDLPARDKDQALAHAFGLAIRRDEAEHHHPASDAPGDRHEVAYRGPHGTGTTLPACCEESARQSARAISSMIAGPVSAVTITTGTSGRREAVFRMGQLVPPAAAPAAPAAEPAATAGPGAEPAPPCLYRSPARGLAARQAEQNTSRARQGSGPAPLHAWRLHPSRPDTPTQRCQTTILTADLRRRGNDPVPPCGHDGPLQYRACCLRPGCDWEGPERDGENTAAEDGCDHAWPGWRDLPAVPEPPHITSGTTKTDRRAIARWTEQVNRIYPAGWLEDGGPIRTRRGTSGRRHVPAGTPYGGYDLAYPADAAPAQPADGPLRPQQASLVAGPEPAGTPAEPAAAGGPPEPAPASQPAQGRQLPDSGGPAGGPAPATRQGRADPEVPQDADGTDQTACTVCGEPMAPVLLALGDTKHPLCGPAEQPSQDSPDRPHRPPEAAAQPAAAPEDIPAAGGLSEPEQDWLRRRDDLHDAVASLAALPGLAGTADGPGFTAADTGLGMFLADLPVGQWTGQMSIAAWAMLGRYTAQLDEAGISYDDLPRPPGAEDLPGAALTAAHETAMQQMAAAWPAMLRGRHGPRYIRCDGPGAVVMVGYDTQQDPELASEATQIPGLHGYDAAAGAGLYSHASLPGIVTLAGRHGIPVTDHVRALAAAEFYGRHAERGHAPEHDGDGGVRCPTCGEATPAAAAGDPPGPQPITGTGTGTVIALRQVQPQNPQADAIPAGDPQAGPPPAPATAAPGQAGTAALRPARTPPALPAGRAPGPALPPPGQAARQDLRASGRYARRLEAGMAPAIETRAAGPLLHAAPALALPPGRASGDAAPAGAETPQARAADPDREPAMVTTTPAAEPQDRPGLPAGRRPSGPPGTRGYPGADDAPEPGTVSPLAATAASGGPHRPHRLLYPGGTALTIRPGGPYGTAWTGIAAGRGGDLGSLQAVLRSDGRVQFVHPALTAPTGTSPYAWMRFRDQQRFSQFDPAEAAGRDSAQIDAALTDRGDLIRARTPSGQPELREITSTVPAGIYIHVSTTGPGGDTRTDRYRSRDRVEVMLPARHPAEDGPYAGRLFTPRPHQIQPGPDARRLSELEARVADLEEEVRRLRASGTPGPHGRPARPAAGPRADPHGWDRAAAGTGPLRQAQAATADAVPGLGGDWLWTRLCDLADSACRLARDADAGRLRFASPDRALRAWRVVWAQVCEMTGDLAGALQARLRPGGRGWRAARRLQHAAAEAVAHARGWLPHGETLPGGSYDPPTGYSAPTWARADAAARLHEAGAGPLGQVDFPGLLAGVPARKTPGPHARRRAARTAAARAAPPGPHPAARP
jgi:hypothetical protein